MAKSTAKDKVLKFLEYHSPVKKLGQHFIIDSEVIKRSIELANFNSEENLTILEIGPGPGSLTQELLNTGVNVVAIELDKDAIQFLNQHFINEISSGRLKLIEGDALRVEWPEEITHIVSNIPYQISSPLLKRIESSNHSIQQIILLLQEEFASRLSGNGPPSNVGPLSLMTSLNWTVEKDLKISPSSFVPSPKVFSRIVKLDRIDRIEQLVDSPPFSNNELPVPSHQLIGKICRHCFNNRRKKIRNTLSNFGPTNNYEINSWKEIFSKVSNLEYERYLGEGWLNRRPEEFKIIEWVILSAVIIHLSNKK